MVVFSPFVLLLCTLWELCARFLIDILLFTDKKKKFIIHMVNLEILFDGIRCINAPDLPYV